MKYQFSDGSALFLAESEYSLVDVEGEVITITTRAGERKTIRVHGPLISKTNPPDGPKEASLIGKTSSFDSRKPLTSKIDDTEGPKKVSLVEKTGSSGYQSLNSEVDTIKHPSGSVSTEKQCIHDTHPLLRNLEYEITCLKSHHLEWDTGYFRPDVDYAKFLEDLKPIKEMCEQSPGVLDLMDEELYEDFIWMEVQAKKIEDDMARENQGSKPPKHSRNKKKKGQKGR
jgi:hypothetical protein